MRERGAQWAVVGRRSVCCDAGECVRDRSTSVCVCVWLCVLRGCCGDVLVMAANGGRWDAVCGLACVDDDSW